MKHVRTFEAFDAEVPGWRAPYDGEVSGIGAAMPPHLWGVMRAPGDILPNVRYPDPDEKPGDVGRFVATLSPAHDAQVIADQIMQSGGRVVHVTGETIIFDARDPRPVAAIDGVVSVKKITEDMKHIKGMNESNQPDRWEVGVATRQDGWTFNVGDTYTDDNDYEYTIKRMYITGKGNVMAETEEGGEIDLWSVEKTNLVK